MPEPAEVMPTFLPASSADLGDLGVRLHDQVPAVIAVRRRWRRSATLTPFLRPAATLDGRVQDQVGRAGGDRLEAFGAAAIDRQLGLDAFLLEQLLADRGFGR